MEIERAPITLSDLQDDFLYQITAHLDIKDLLNLFKVNKRLNKFINQNEFWNIYFMYSQHSIKFKNYNLTSLEMRSFLLSHDYLCRNHNREIRLESLKSTTQDNQQNIFETLNDSPHLFWSSLGTPGVDDRDEELWYIVDNGFAYINSFSLKFFFANYLQTKIYPCRRIKFEAGVDSSNLNYSENFVCNTVYQENIEDYTVDYTLKQPVYAKVIKITLGGRVGLQETDNQYYIAVERFKVIGVPITLFDSDKDNTELDEYIKLKTGSEEESKKIKQLTQRLAQLIAKNQSTDEHTLFNKRAYQQNQAKIFIETKNLNLFEVQNELRANYSVYEVIMKEPTLMYKYLQNFVNHTTQLSELESFTVIMQKCNNKLIFKILSIMVELYQSRQASEMTDDVCKVFYQQLSQFIIFAVKQNILPYDSLLQQIDYLSESYQYYYLIVEQMSEYFNVPDELQYQIQDRIRRKLANNQVTVMLKRMLYKQIFWTLIPVVFKEMLTDILKSNLLSQVTPKSSLFSLHFTGEEIIPNPLSSEEITPQNIQTSKKVSRLMNDLSIDSIAEILELDRSMRQSAKDFIDSKDLNLILNKPEFLKNTYVFEQLMFSEELISQYVSVVSQNKSELNELESVAVFVQAVNYPLIVKYLDLTFEILQQAEIQNMSQIEQKGFRDTISKLFEFVFISNVKAKQISINKEKLESLTYTKSTSLYYYFVKPLQNYLSISDDDVETIAQLLRQKISIGVKSSKKVLAYSDFKYFVQETLLSELMRQIYSHITSQYYQLPSLKIRL